MKKGMLSMFMIIGLLFLISFSIYHGFQVKVSGDYSRNPVVDLSAISQYVESCLYKTTEDGARLAATQGGYITDRRDMVDFEGRRVPYYIFMEEIRHPTLEEISSEIELYVKTRIKDCLREDFDESVKYSGGEPLVTIAITHRIDALLQYEVNVRNRNSESILDSFSASVNLPLERLYRASVGYPSGITHQISSYWNEGREFRMEDCDLAYEGLMIKAMTADRNTKIINLHMEGMIYRFAVSRSPMLFLGENCP